MRSLKFKVELKCDLYCEDTNVCEFCLGEAIEEHGYFDVVVTKLNK